MATYENEHAVITLKDDDTRYQITTFRDAPDGAETLCMGSATTGDLLKALKRLSEIVVGNAVKKAIEDFSDRGGLIAALCAYEVKKAPGA